MIAGTYNNVMVEEIKVPVDGSRDRYNELEYRLLARDIEARKIETVNLVRNKEGNEVRSEIELRLPPTLQRLPSRSKIKFRSEDESREVITSEIITGITKPKLQKVYL